MAITVSFKTSIDLHATLVRNGRGGLLILGDSGSGKTALALVLLTVGWKLVADDVVVLENRDGTLLGSAPKRFVGLVAFSESGRVGVHRISRHLVAAPCEVVAAVHLDKEAAKKGKESLSIAGIRLPLEHFPVQPFAATGRAELFCRDNGYYVAQEQCFALHDALLAGAQLNR